MIQAVVTHSKIPPVSRHIPAVTKVASHPKTNKIIVKPANLDSQHVIIDQVEQSDRKDSLHEDQIIDTVEKELMSTNPFLTIKYTNEPGKLNWEEDSSVRHISEESKDYENDFNN